MKNILRRTGLAVLIAGAGLSLTGCLEESPKREYTLSGEGFNQKMGEFAAHYSGSIAKTTVQGVRTWRNYPAAGRLKPLPRAEIREYESGRKEIDLYYPVER